MSTSTDFQPLQSSLRLSGAAARPLSAEAVETPPAAGRRVLKSLWPLVWMTTMSLAVPALAVFDAQWAGKVSSEASATELAQECLLLLSAVMFARAASRHVAMRPILLLAAGLFATMLVRELDAFWDLVRHGFWVYPATAVAAVAIWRASREPTPLLASWARYAQTKSYLLVSTGLLIVLVLSRTFGSQIIWGPILANSDVLLVKTVIQEGLELFGYLFIFWAAVEINAAPLTLRDTSSLRDPLWGDGLDQGDAHRLRT